MTQEEYLLIKLSEECAEVQQAVSKALLFGLNDCDPNLGYPVTNLEQILTELNHVLASASMLSAACIIPNDWCEPSTQFNKIAKVIKYSNRSVEKGKLDSKLNSKMLKNCINKREGL